MWKKFYPITKPISQKPENGVCLMRRLQQNWGTRKIFMHLTNPKASSAKNENGKISDNAEYLADKAQQKMQQTWNEVSPHIPDAASATASVLAKAFFTLCTVLSIFLFAATLLTIIYYLCILLPLWMRIPYRDSTR